jgi:hypothetical protein
MRMGINLPCEGLALGQSVSVPCQALLAGMRGQAPLPLPADCAWSLDELLRGDRGCSFVVLSSLEIRAGSTWLSAGDRVEDGGAHPSRIRALSFM